MIFLILIAMMLKMKMKIKMEIRSRKKKFSNVDRQHLDLKLNHILGTTKLVDYNDDYILRKKDGDGDGDSISINRIDSDSASALTRDTRENGERRSFSSDREPISNQEGKLDNRPATSPRRRDSLAASMTIVEGPQIDLRFI